MSFGVTNNLLGLINMFVIQLLYEEDVEEDILNHVENALAKVFNCRVIRTRISVPRSFYDARRNQYLADLVVEYASRYREDDAYAILLTTKDAYIPGLNFVFGLAIPSLKTAAVFLARLKQYANKDLLLLRIEKEVLHELGHLLGLEHCNTPGCVMNFSNSIADVDRKSNRYCRKCYSRLVPVMK